VTKVTAPVTQISPSAWNKKVAPIAG